MAVRFTGSFAIMLLNGGIHAFRVAMCIVTHRLPPPSPVRSAASASIKERLDLIDAPVTYIYNRSGNVHHTPSLLAVNPGLHGNPEANSPISRGALLTVVERQ